jgi:hypothetical protein
MGYLHIPQLYKEQRILLFKECFALEKIHGSSAHVKFSNGTLDFFAGGEKHDNFVAIFNQEALKNSFIALGHTDIIVFGEVYGGKCQGMSKTYGTKLSFVGFDVKIGDAWLSVPNAKDVCDKLGLDFVDFKRIPAEVSAIDAERDAPSEQAFKNGCAVREDKSTWKIREGVVLRPIEEMRDNNGDRIISKHKRPEFSERATPQNVDHEKKAIMDNAEAIALEWVTDMRLEHVLDKLGNPTDITAMPKVITAMIEDVTREASGEILDDKIVRKAVGSRACKLFKAKVNTIQ